LMATGSVHSDCITYGNYMAVKSHKMKAKIIHLLVKWCVLQTESGCTLMELIQDIQKDGVIGSSYIFIL
jgi:hypothetical protein